MIHKAYPSDSSEGQCSVCVAVCVFVCVAVCVALGSHYRRWWRGSGRRPLPYLADHLQHEPSAVGISIIIKVIHDPVVLCPQLLVLLIVAAAELLVHDAELELAQRSEGGLEVQTLGVRGCRCDTQHQDTHREGPQDPQPARDPDTLPHHGLRLGFCKMKRLPVCTLPVIWSSDVGNVTRSDSCCPGTNGQRESRIIPTRIPARVNIANINLE